MDSRILSLIRKHPMPKRILIRDLITSGLNYCCPYAFFRKNKRTGLIAARLGVTDRAVRYWKMAFKDNCLSCEKRENCLKGRLF
jgi:hypothetical protein